MNKKIIWIVAIVVLFGVVFYLIVFRRGNSVSTVAEDDSGKTYANNSVASNSVNNRQNIMSPADTYLAYKKELFTKTKTAEDIVSLARKYLVGVVAQGWDAAGGASAVFSKSIAVCAWINAQKAISPEASLIKVDGQKTVNPQSVTLNLSASGGYKGKADVTLENGEWKVYQESWPNWTPPLVPCSD